MIPSSLFNVSSTNYGQEFQAGHAHALKCQVKRLIHVNMRKTVRVHKFA